MKNKSSILYLLFVLTIIYYTVAIAAPIVITYKNIDYTDNDNEYDSNKVCSSGVGTIALIIYFSFAIVSAIIELYLFIYVYKKVGNLLPNPIDIKDYDE